MKQAVIIGAGSIGRGFLGQILTEAGYAVTFLDVSAPLVDALNAAGEYPLEIVSSRGAFRKIVSPVSAVNGSDREAAARVTADADIAVTCVGAKALPYIIPNLAAGVKLRYAEGRSPLDLLICENLMDADAYIRSLLEPVLTPQELASVGLVETSVGRMVPLPDKSLLEKEPLLVRAEAYSVLPCDRDAFRGELPDCPNIVPISPFRFVVERKLYIHNMGHAVCAYLGLLRGHGTVAAAIADPEIRLVVREAMTESAVALAKRYDQPLDTLLAHTDDLIRRFGNTALGDTCARVGGDIPRKLAKSDRLTGASLSVLEAGGHPAFIAIGAAAALIRHAPDDPEAAFDSLTGVTEGEYRETVLRCCAMLAEGKPLSALIRTADEFLSDAAGMLM